MFNTPIEHLGYSLMVQPPDRSIEVDNIITSLRKNPKLKVILTIVDDNDVIINHPLVCSLIMDGILDPVSALDCDDDERPVISAHYSDKHKLFKVYFVDPLTEKTKLDEVSSVTLREYLLSLSEYNTSAMLIQY